MGETIVGASYKGIGDMETFQEEQPVTVIPLSKRLAMMILPLFGLGVIFLVAGITAGAKGFWFLLITGLGGFVGAGKLVIFAGAAKTAPVGVWGLAGLVVYSDLMTALIILANMQYLYRLPWAGSKLASLRLAGRRVLRANPWMRRAAFLGVAFFVSVPFQGTGSVLGVILARILGLSRTNAVLAITIGSAVGCSAVALLTRYARDKITALAGNPVLGIAVIAGIIVAAYLLGRKFTGGDNQD